VTTQGVIELAYNQQLTDSLFEWTDHTAKQQYERTCAQLDSWPFHMPDVTTASDRAWFTPAEYTQINLHDHVLIRCVSPEQITRAQQELKLIDHLNVAHIFRHLIYLVDVWRSKNLVWGIGRGSSVSSFVLYVIGLNKINPLDYDLSCEEFFKIDPDSI
jgi:DNA polymerase III alpha subunit